MNTQTFSYEAIIIEHGIRMCEAALLRQSLELKHTKRINFRYALQQITNTFRALLPRRVARVQSKTEQIAFGD